MDAAEIAGDVNSPAPSRFRFRLRSLFIAIGLTAVFFGGCRLALHYMNTPKVSPLALWRDLRRDLPAGTPEAEVIRYCESMKYQVHAAAGETDFFGRRTLECWIMNSGAPGDTVPTDLQLVFALDKDGRLDEIRVAPRPRF